MLNKAMHKTRHKCMRKEEINPWREHQCFGEGIQTVCYQEVW